MSNRRYSFKDANSQPLNTGVLLYVSSSTYAGDWKSFPHTHYFTEIFYIMNGSGYFLIENETINAEKGMMVIINAHAKHTEVSNAVEPMEYIVFGIEGIKFSFNDDAYYGVFMYDNNSNQSRSVFDEILSELRNKQNHYVQVCQSLLNVLLVWLTRKELLHLSISPMQAIPPEINLVKEYIDKNFFENLTLDDLADYTHMNKYYLSHRFTTFVGIAPMQYLQEQRIRCSKEHLRDSDLSIAQVAEVSGFSSQSYFTQIFKKMVGYTPLEYRKLTSQNIIEKDD